MCYASIDKEPIQTFSDEDTPPPQPIPGGNEKVNTDETAGSTKTLSPKDGEKPPIIDIKSDEDTPPPQPIPGGP